MFQWAVQPNKGTFNALPIKEIKTTASECCTLLLILQGHNQSVELQRLFCIANILTNAYIPVVRQFVCSFKV